MRLWAFASGALVVLAANANAFDIPERARNDPRFRAAVQQQAVALWSADSLVRALGDSAQRHVDTARTRGLQGADSVLRRSVAKRDSLVVAVVRGILLCVLGGTLGSAISALLSAAERISHGWEFSEGDRYPTPEPKDKFVLRMVPFFLVRPFLGSAMGLLVYAGLTSGYLIAVENAQDATFSRQGLLFFSFLGGLFAKTFIEKLRAMFDTFFGT